MSAKEKARTKTPRVSGEALKSLLLESEQSILLFWTENDEILVIQKGLLDDREIIEALLDGCKQINSKLYKINPDPDLAERIREGAKENGVKTE